MVAYSFKQQFVSPIVAGTKAQTIRADRRRHARPGEAIQLYTGMRTKQCRLIGRATCIDADEVRLDLEHGRIEALGTGLARTTQEELDAFAILDGFDGWRSMRKFWAENHPGVPVFSGVLIRWGGLEIAGV